MTRPRLLAAALFLVPALACASGPEPERPKARGEAFPERVLITNDDGINDPGIRALARALAERAEVWVVAPSQDRSGSGSYISVNRSNELTLERRDFGSGVHAFAVDGYPADCVLVGILGLMKDAPPDMVISGFNNSPNLGADWMFSGTIGAARVAALAGVPAMAVSGLNRQIAGATEAAVEWVVRLAEGELMHDLGPRGYLTVAIPWVPPAQIRGVRLADRAPLRLVPQFEAGAGGVWRVVGTDEIGPIPSTDSDQAVWAAGYIVVTPMRADEVDADAIRRWHRRIANPGSGMP